MPQQGAALRSQKTSDEDSPGQGRNLTHKIDEAAEREKASRSIFAQNAIKAHRRSNRILRAVDESNWRIPEQ